MPEMPVEVRVEGVRARVLTGADGTFAAELPAPAGARFVPGVLTAWVQSDGTLAAVPVTVLDPSAPFLVVSDFDDTLAQTYVRTPRRLLGSALFRDGLTQPAVPGMAGLFRCLLRDKVARPGLVILSGSPISWAPRVRTLLLREGFPTAALMLRPSLQSATVAHKLRALEWLSKVQAAPLLLVGDSGERDPEIYAEFRAAHPDRVLAVYIRDAGGPLDAGRLKGAVPFGSAAEAAADAAARGWVTQDCVDAEVLGAGP
jgi:phosphatidate phosphatase APP1